MAAGPACRCRPPQTSAPENPNRSRQLHQRVFHINDLVKPGAEQILLTALPSLAWSHRKSPAPSARARRITASDSRESSKSICKEIAVQRPKTGKFDYLSGPNHPAHSIAFKFFTDDYFMSPKSNSYISYGCPPFL